MQVQICSDLTISISFLYRFEDATHKRIHKTLCNIVQPTPNDNPIWIAQGIASLHPGEQHNKVIARKLALSRALECVRAGAIPKWCQKYASLLQPDRYGVSFRFQKDIRKIIWQTYLTQTKVVQPRPVPIQFSEDDLAKLKNLKHRTGLSVDQLVAQLINNAYQELVVR